MNPRKNDDVEIIVHDRTITLRRRDTPHEIELTFEQLDQLIDQLELLQQQLDDRPPATDSPPAGEPQPPDANADDG